MAVTHWYTGRAGETSATVVVRADATGDVAVVANGVTLQAECDTSVDDGNALVEFTGLEPGTDYDYTVGGVAGGRLRTFSRDKPIWLAFTSCWAIAQRDSLAQMLLRAPLSGADRVLHQEMVANLRAFFALGDLVYMNSSSTVNGYLLTLVAGGTLANASSLEVRRQYYRAGRQVPGLRELMRSIPTYVLKDDHEYDPDNGRPTLTWMDASFPATAPHDQADLDAVWGAATTAWREWAIGNPARTLLSDYFTVRVGDTEIFCTDQIQERGEVSDVDGPDKRMMSAVQEEQLLDDMRDSPASFKFWASTKQFISSCGRNADGWCNLPGAASGGYETQLARILADSRFPRAGALSVTGDEHIKSDLFVGDDHFGIPHTHISQIAAGPATIDVITDPDDGLAYRDGVMSKERDVSGAARRGENNYVLLRVLDTRVERYVLSSRYGLRYMGHLGTSDNRIRR